MLSLSCSQQQALLRGRIAHRRSHFTFNCPRTVSRNRSYIQEFAELLGDTAGDPGHWNYAPEWFGTQASGWGRNEGDVVFYGQSQHGNGLVTVTSHIAAPWPALAADSTQEAEEWRVLRFNMNTRQSVNRVLVRGDGSRSGTARVVPQCLAWPYLKVMASAGAAVLSMTLQPALYTAAVTQPPTQPQPGSAAPHIVCVGLGGGSLPACLAHHFPGARVTAVELDPLVVEAAQKGMGLGSSSLPNLTIVEGDAADYMRELAASAPGSVAQVYIDAFDGQDLVPRQLCTGGLPFMAHLAAALHPAHGSLLINLHSEGTGGLAPADKLRIMMGMDADKGYDTALLLGGRISAVGAAFKEALLQGSSSGGAAFTSADRYGGGNVTAIVARGLQLPSDFKAAGRAIQAAAAAGGREAGFVFAAEKFLQKTAIL